MPVIANLTYRRGDVQNPAWQDLQFGRLFWGGPDKDYFQIFMDTLPLVHHKEWFIGNALIPDPPPLFGEIRAKSGKLDGGRRNRWNKLGHIGTRETPDGGATQYYGQLLAIPVAAIVWQARSNTNLSCLILDIKKEE
jgi:hypothetical protein